MQNGNTGIDYSPDHLLRTLELALMAKELGDGPYGALIVHKKGQIISEAANTTNSENSVTYHAEINAIQQAEYKLGKGNLDGCILYSSAEPCPMCAAAIGWSGISKVVYGLSISSVRQIGVRQINMGCREVLGRVSHQVEVTGPVNEEMFMKLFR